MAGTQILLFCVVEFSQQESIFSIHLWRCAVVSDAHLLRLLACLLRRGVIEAQTRLADCSPILVQHWTHALRLDELISSHSSSSSSSSASSSSSSSSSSSLFASFNPTHPPLSADDQRQISALSLPDVLLRWQLFDLGGTSSSVKFGRSPAKSILDELGLLLADASGAWKASIAFTSSLDALGDAEASVERGQADSVNLDLAFRSLPLRKQSSSSNLQMEKSCFTIPSAADICWNEEHFTVCCLLRELVGLQHLC